MNIPNGTYVVASGRLGRIVRSKTMNGAPGYDVQTAIEERDGYGLHFYADWCVQVAELGVNVCRQPRFQHYCGLLHVDHPELLAAAS